MSSESVTKLYQLQKKYNCEVKSYFDKDLLAMIFTASVGPSFNVKIQIPESELVRENSDLDLLEEYVYEYFDEEFSKHFNKDECLKSEGAEKDNIIYIRDWRDTH